MCRVAATRLVPAVSRRNRPICADSGRAETPGHCDDLREAVGEAVESSAQCAGGRRTTVHFKYVLSGNKRINDTVDARVDSGQRRRRLGYEVSRSGLGELELPLEVRHDNVHSKLSACLNFT